MMDCISSCARQCEQVLLCLIGIIALEADVCEQDHGFGEPILVQGVHLCKRHYLLLGIVQRAHVVVCLCEQVLALCADCGNSLFSQRC